MKFLKQNYSSSYVQHVNYGRNFVTNSQWYILLIGWVQRVNEQVPAFINVCKRLLRVHTNCHKREYWWEFAVCPQSSILHPKSTKLGRLGIFNLLEIAFKSLHIYHNQQKIVSIDHK